MVPHAILEECRARRLAGLRSMRRPSAEARTLRVLRARPRPSYARLFGNPERARLPNMHAPSAAL